VCGPFLSHTLAKGCGGFDALYNTGTDVGSIEYFDSATGKLVAIADYSANFGGSVQCIAGPAGLVAPSCPSIGSPLACPDAGAPDDGSSEASDGGAGDSSDAAGD
jgi:hypothetical protein